MPSVPHAEADFQQVQAQWVADHLYPPVLPPPSGQLGLQADEDITVPVILVYTGVTADAAQQGFQAGYSFFDINANYDKDKNEFESVAVGLFVPGYDKEPLLVNDTSYTLSEEEGKRLAFNIGNTIKGTISFKYVTPNGGVKSIGYTYDVDIPYAGNLVDDGIPIAPTDPAAIFAKERLQSIPIVSPHHLKQKHDATVRKLGASFEENSLVLQFLNDYSTPDKTALHVASFTTTAQQYKFSYFFLVFEIVGSIDLASLFISASLFAKSPFVGRFRLASVQGSLPSVVTVEIDVPLAKGTAKFFVKKEGKYILYTNINITFKYNGVVNTGDLRLFALPV